MKTLKVIGATACITFITACDSGDIKIDTPPEVVSAPVTEIEEVEELQVDIDSLLAFTDKGTGPVHDYDIEEVDWDIVTHDELEEAKGSVWNPASHDESGEMDAVMAAEAYIYALEELRLETEEEVVPTGPYEFWGRDLANYMSSNPQEGYRRYGNAMLIITGQISASYSDGVSLGGLFVGGPGVYGSKGQTITVYCHGVQAGGNWGILAFSTNCER